MRKIVVILCLYIIASCNTQPQEKIVEQKDTLEEKIDSYFKALTKLRQFNGAVIVEKNKNLIINQAYTITKDSLSKLYVTTDHQFDLRSISKLVAKTAIIQLEREGKINRNDSITKFLKNFPNGNKITIQHLMDNTSGLPRRLEGNFDFFSMEVTEIIDLIKNVPLEFEPGSDTRYSNLGFEVLYYIIYKVSGKPFSQYVQDNIFDKLGMVNSGAHFYTTKKNLTKFAYYNILENDSIVEIDHFDKERKRQANLYATTEDLMKLMEYISTEPFASAFKNEKNIIGHSGGSKGIRSHVQTNISKGYSFAFLCNYDEIPFSQIISDLESIIEGNPYTIPKELNRNEIYVTPELLKQYVGRYDIAEFNHKIIEFRVENDSLIFYQNEKRDVALKAENDSTFFFDPKSSDSFIFRKHDTVCNVYMKWKGVEFKGTPIAPLEDLP